MTTQENTQGILLKKIKENYENTDDNIFEKCIIIEGLILETEFDSVLLQASIILQPNIYEEAKKEYRDGHHINMAIIASQLMQKYKNNFIEAMFYDKLEQYIYSNIAAAIVKKLITKPIADCFTPYSHDSILSPLDLKCAFEKEFTIHSLFKHSLVSLYISRIKDILFLQKLINDLQKRVEDRTQYEKHIIKLVALNNQKGFDIETSLRARDVAGKEYISIESFKKVILECGLNEECVDCLVYIVAECSMCSQSDVVYYPYFLKCYRDPLKEEEDIHQDSIYPPNLNTVPSKIEYTELINQIKAKVKECKISICEELALIDLEKKSAILKDSFIEYCTNKFPEIKKEELNIIVDAYKNTNGQIEYKRFADEVKYIDISILEKTVIPDILPSNDNTQEFNTFANPTSVNIKQSTSDQNKTNNENHSNLDPATEQKGNTEIIKIQYEEIKEKINLNPPDHNILQSTDINPYTKKDLNENMNLSNEKPNGEKEVNIESKAAKKQR